MSKKTMTIALMCIILFFVLAFVFNPQLLSDPKGILLALLSAIVTFFLIARKEP
ncbi:MAG: hypothetical protein ACRC2R_16920 [Xenococcaceae cyanobacterium]